MHKNYTKVYDSGVVPIMDYASGVWGFKNYDKPQVVHNRAQRAFLGVHRYASNVVVNGDMGWISPVVRRKLDIIRLWSRLDKMQDTRLTKRIFLWDKSLKLNNWSRDCKKVLKEIGYEDIWNMSASDINLKELLKEARNVLMDKVKAQWERDLFSQNKLRVFRTYKQDFMAENYVICNLSKTVRSFIAKLRSSTLPIRIETGRFERLDETDRLCKYCETVPPSIENEVHFMFECNAYAMRRVELLNHVLVYYPDFMDLSENVKWNLLMCDKRLISKTGNFIKDAFMIRNGMLFRM